MRSKVELFAAIRRDARIEGLSIRELAAKHRVHRRTVRQALASAIPPPRKMPSRTSPRLSPFRTAIDEMLRADLDAPKKQRHTARRILARLVDEHGAGDLSYSTVRDYVRKRRPEIAAEAGKPLEEGFVPQTHTPAAEAEVDFHDLWVILRGVKTKTALFTMRLSFSGRAAHRASLSQGQEAFLESHVYVFDRLGGAPTEQIRYDNLKPAVSRVLFGRTRVETQRWVAFRSTYGFEAFYCQPGHEGSHEKGGVEGEGGRFRRNHCVPMPRVDSIAELNALLEAWDDADDARRIGNRAMSVGQDWAIERPLLRPLPDEPFDTTLTLTPRVDRYAQIMVRCCQYSVPARFIGHRVRVKLSSTTVRVFDRDMLVAQHERAVGKGVQVLELDHYLEILLRKPGALPGATALVQARAAGVFTSEHEAFWAAARKQLGDSAGTRALIEVLLQHRHLDRAAVLAGITAALSIGSTSSDVVAVEA
ncbi:MAG: IS21 family transposase, partial [Pseudonocardiaceae bacterium]|nr:IS21 family transposase [Pseudonocardiaceae bacterium]